MLEIDLAFEARRFARAGLVVHFVVAAKNLLYAIESGGGFGIRVDGLGDVLHGLVHLAEVEDEDDQ